MINNFRGEYSWLSNFYLRAIVIAGITFPSNEHWFVANKTLDKEKFMWLVDSPTPGIAKSRGREIICRPDWKPKVRVEVMAVGLYQKYMQHNDLKKKLIGTGQQELVEGNWWHDNFWGDCYCKNKSGHHPECLQTGSNVLGRLHMELRKLFLSWAEVGYTSKAGNLAD